MKLFMTRPLPDPVIQAARARFDTTIRPDTTPLDFAECVRVLADYDVVLPTLGDVFSADVFASAGVAKCKLLANFGVGYNHIDIAAAKAAGVAVTNTPGAVTDATADIALGLILMTARRAGEGERLVRSGAWSGWHPTQMLGLHVTGKTVAIIGMGRIGQAIARRCHYGFGCDIVYVNRSVKSVDVPAKQMPMKQALALADIVVVATPGGADTHHLINATSFAAMQAHAVFINIARGDVVDEAALIAALQSGQIAGAGLDVYEFEPKVPAALCAMENVVLLPHLGTATPQVRQAMGQLALDNVIAFAENRPLISPV